MVRTGQVDLDGPVRIFTATEVLGDSSRAAMDAAEEWVSRDRP